MRRLILVPAIFSGTAHAHPEHPGGLMSLAHMLTEPDHLALLLLPLAIAAGIWFYRRSTARRRKPD